MNGLPKLHRLQMLDCFSHGASNAASIVSVCVLLLLLLSQRKHCTEDG